MPADKLVPGSAVFVADRRAGRRSTTRCSGGATRRARTGSIPTARAAGSNGREDHPVVHVAYDDAWRTRSGRASACRPKRSSSSPRAAASIGSAIPWGNELKPGGKPAANTWQGRFPARDRGEDGYLGDVAGDARSPERVRPVRHGRQRVAMVLRLVSPRHLRRRGRRRRPSRGTRRGRPTASTRQEPGAAKHVLRGGSYLCTDRYLRPLPGRQPRQVRGQQRHVEPGVPAGPIGLALVGSLLQALPVS